MPEKDQNNIIEIERYDSGRAGEWNRFVAESKNGTFLFDRGYMDYHADRFKDFSLMLRHKGKLVGLLPANMDGDTINSHGGLTYGGLILSRHIHTKNVIDMFLSMKEYLKATGFKKMIYKPIPYIYCRMPSQEDLYAMFRVSEATLAGRNISSAIDTRCPGKMAELRRRCVKKATKAGVTVRESADFGPFWEILGNNLRSRFGVSPVHTIEEITMLHRRFPDNIRLFVSEIADRTVAGAVVYLTDTTAHTQYLSADDEGKRTGALDLLLQWLSSEKFKDKPYFDFGTSNENSGQFLNEGLINQKEGFGGHGVIYDTYLIPLQ